MILVFLFIAVIPVIGKVKLPVAPDERFLQISEKERIEQVYYLHQGIKYSYGGDERRATECYRRAIKADPYCDACYYKWAGIYLDHEQYDEALSLAKSAYRIDSSNIWYGLRVALLYAMQNNYNEAERVYTACLKQDPQQREIYIYLLMVYDKKKEYEKSIELLSLYQENFGIDDMSLLAKQSIYYEWGKTSLAIEQVEQLIDIYPFEQRYYLILSELYTVSGNDSLAFLNLEKAGKIDSTFLEYQMFFTDYYRKRLDYDNYFRGLTYIFNNPETPFSVKLNELELLQQFPSLSNLYSKQVDLLFDFVRNDAGRISYRVEQLYAQYLIRNLKYDSAVSVLKNVMRHAASDSILNNLLEFEQKSLYYDSYGEELEIFYSMSQSYIDLLLTKVQWKDIISAIDSEAKYFKDKSRILYLKGYALFTEKQYDSSIEVLKSALQCASKSDTSFIVQIHTTLGDSYFNLGHYPDTYKYYDKALEYYPDNVLVLNNYAYYLSLRGDKLEKALSMSGKSIEREPNNPTYLDTYAWILYKLGKFEEAKTVFRRAFIYEGANEPVILEHYGDVLYELGEYSNAKIYWNRAIEKDGDVLELRKKIQKLESEAK
ncbi:MAG: tetratricopeptide repeat protein [Prevotellaceae bacterium]|nr:tetratricopeptide repeat protein [Prevotellaceae bacterium]